jgi:hypothetical protein
MVSLEINNKMDIKRRLFNLISIILGWVLNQTNYEKIRNKYFLAFIEKQQNKGIDIEKEIRKQSLWWYYSNIIHRKYLIFKHRKMSNYNWQNTKWEQYAEIYYKLREGDIVHDKFLEYFQDAVNKKSIECVFQYLKDSSSSIVGVLQEPFSDSELTKIIKDRDYCHNFESYIEQYGFTMKKMHKEGIYGIYYFIT